MLHGRCLRTLRCESNRSLYEASRNNRSEAASIAPAAVTMLFLFNLIYAATWDTAAFLVPTEIFPPEMRAQGNGFGITGWVIGVGWTILINPITFAHIESRTHFLFASLNLLWIPTVYFFLPRDRESISRVDQHYICTVKALLPRYGGSLCGWR